MSKRVWCAAFALGLVLVACGGSEPGSRTVESQFLPQTVDSLDDVGRGVSLALDKDGSPHLAYIGLIAVLAAGEIPAAHAPTAPAFPAVLTTTEQNGLFTHGFVVQTDISAANLPTLPLNTDSDTSIAIGDDGTSNVVWTQAPGLFYSSAPIAAPPAAPTFGEPQKITSAFAFSPSIALAADGRPEVVFEQIDDTGTASLRFATLSSDKKPTWEVEQVRSFGQCRIDGCTSLSAALGVTPDGPVVVFADPITGQASLAAQTGSSWDIRPLDLEATGVSLAVAKDGSLHITYARTSGEVVYATAPDATGEIRSTTVGRYSPSATTPTPPVTSPPPSPPPSASASASASPSPSASPSASVAPAKKKPPVLQPGTAVAIDPSNGTVYVAWTDPQDRNVKLSSSKDGTTFSGIDTPGTEEGESPAMAVGTDGKVQLAWYNADAEDLELGTYPEKLDVLAVPPASTSAAPQGGGSVPSQKCPKDTVEIIAPPGAGGAGFQTTSVEASSGNFQLCFNNEDSAAPHNVQIFESEADADAGATPLAQDEPFTGPKLDTFQVSGLAPGDYFFHCVVHPGPMKGTLTVK